MATPALAQSTRITWKVTKILARIVFWLLAIFGFVTLGTLIVLELCVPPGQVDPAAASLVRSAAAEGKLAYKLTVPEELKAMLAMLGPPIAQTTINDGGMQKLILDWPGVNAAFIKMKDYSSPFTLLYMKVGGKSVRIGNFTDIFGGMPVDVGQGRPIVLRDENDLTKFDPFWGLAGVSLVNVDLKGHAELLEKMPFDSRTKWPALDKLPEGLDPAALLEEGKNPGLGVRSLHEQGIDGRGVTIAIIDQPLLLNHKEYASQLVKYEKVGLIAKLAGPQMHASPVSSIAIGRTCGVAPKASLYYFAVPMWKADNRPYCDVIDKIIGLNKNRSVPEQIRVVSISTGMFPQQANFDRWKETLKKAEQNGILVVTCDPAFLEYGTLARIPGQDPDRPSSYHRGRYYRRNDVLLVPTGNRTIASHYGPEVYTYERVGGMSWATPYLAGLAALAHQIKPEIEPRKIVELWLQTATGTDVGPIINPVGFIEAVRKLS